jgi:hypothetical protein
MTETQLRFVRAILERVPVDRVAELYLFPPMKQGIHESGIAVVAAVRAEDGAAPAGEASEGAAAVGGADAAAIALGAESCDPTEDASREADLASAGDHGAGFGASAQPDEAEAPEAPPAAAPARSVPVRERHTVYTARYRLTIKGPERGRWELNVVDEADAPLLTVDLVVRGVQRRAGDGAEPERIDAPALRDLLEGADARR